jgi:hypothetical protein
MEDFDEAEYVQQSMPEHRVARPSTSGPTLVAPDNSLQEQVAKAVADALDKRQAEMERRAKMAREKEHSKQIEILLSSTATTDEKVAACRYLGIQSPLKIDNRHSPQVGLNLALWSLRLLQLNNDPKLTEAEKSAGERKIIEESCLGEQPRTPPVQNASRADSGAVTPTAVQPPPIELFPIPTSTPRCTSIRSSVPLVNIQTVTQVNEVWPEITDGDVVSGKWTFGGHPLASGIRVFINRHMLYQLVGNVGGQYYLHFSGRARDGHLVPCGQKGTLVTLK